MVRSLLCVPSPPADIVSSHSGQHRAGRLDLRCTAMEVHTRRRLHPRAYSTVHDQSDGVEDSTLR